VETPTIDIAPDAAAADATAVADLPPAAHRTFAQGLAVAVCALVVFVAWGGLVFWHLGELPFHSKGEPREGLVVWEMTHGGGWILPQRNGTELPSKPPLFHWLGAIASLAHRATDEWSIRFPSAALSLAGLLAVFAAGTALCSPRAGLYAGLILMTSFEWARAATSARVDMTLTVGLEGAFLSLLFFWRSRSPAWLVPLYLSIAWAVLGKGPVGIALPGLVAAVLIVLSWDSAALKEKRIGAVFDWSALRQLRLVRGAIAVGLLAGTWYVLALFIGGWAFFRKQILAENIFTFLNDPGFGGGHRHNLFYLPLQLVLGFLPWSLFLPGLAALLWRRRQELGRGDWRVYLLVWIAVVFTFFEVAASKRGVYLLSSYPAVALLLGWWWDEQGRATGTLAWLGRAVAAVCWIVAGVACIAALVAALESFGLSPLSIVEARLSAKAAVGLALGREIVRDCGLPLTAALLLAASGFAVSGRLGREASWSTLFVALFASAAIALLATRLIVMPAAARQLTLRDFMTGVRRVVEPDASLSFYRTFDYQAVYYSQRHIPAFDGTLFTDGPRYLLVERGLWQTEQARAGLRYQQVAVENDRRLVLLRHIDAP
jgi:4-amino-4-deoxy-L-arabinose transferase-like glycosyltransferase